MGYLQVSRSGRASCQACGHKIDLGVVRYGGRIGSSASDLYVIQNAFLSKIFFLLDIGIFRV